MAHHGERQNEYFIEKDGISREVIQADICRYLGNDALVRPGNYQNRPGYYIRGYRNLTSEMIADLKADSARWEADVARRRQQGYPQATYDSSTIHETRQQMGPSSYSSQPYRDPYSSPPHAYGSSAPNPPYVSQSSGYPSVPAYGSGPPYVPGQTPPAVTTSDMHGSYTYSSGAAYPYNDGRSAAPRYSGQGYEADPDYSPGVTSGMPYPATTSAADPRMIDPRYSAEPVYPDHGSQPSRTQPPRDRDPHRRVR